MHPRRILFAAVIGLSWVAPASAADTTVSIQNFTFTPTKIQVPIGTTVIFKNADDIPHSVIAVDGSFHSKALDTDDRFSFTFTKPGDYAYYCGLHPHMQGKITVVP
jgi:plastocyanin